MQAALLLNGDLLESQRAELPSVARRALTLLQDDLTRVGTMPECAHSAHSACAEMLGCGLVAPVWLHELTADVGRQTRTDLQNAVGNEGAAAHWSACGRALARLTCDAPACEAFTRALKLRPSLSCSLELARIAASGGAVRRAFDALTDVLLCMDTLRPARSQAEVTVSVLASVSQLISVAGMSAVQSMLQVTVGQVHPAIEVTVELAFERGTDGCGD